MVLQNKIKIFNKEVKLNIFPRKFSKSICGIRAVINNDGKYLIIQRSITDKAKPLFWEFPGGAIKQNEDVYLALKREVLEEVNMDIDVKNNACFLWYDDVPKKSASPYKGCRRYVFIFECTGKLSDVALSYEHSDYKWVSKKEALKFDLTADTKKYFLSLP